MPRGSIVALVLVLLFAAGAAWGQSPEIETTVWKDPVYQGESFIYQITVRGARNIREPSLDALESFQPREIPRQWLWSYQNDDFDPSNLPDGRHFFFRLMSPQTGEITVPSTTLLVDGRRRRTSPITMTVVPPPPQDEFILELGLSKREVFVGEPVTLNAVWYARDDASFYFANIPLLRHPQVQLGERADTGGSAGLFLRMSGGSQRLTGTPGRVTRNGMEYETMTLEQPLVMRASGTYEFPRATVQVWRSKRIEGRSRAYRGYEQTVVGSNGLNITVNPLPQAGRPADFTGIVSDNLQVESFLSHEEMNVGDPVTLQVQLRGAPSPENVDFPALESFPGLADAFAVGPDEMATDTEDDAAVFTQTIRVKDDGVTEVPALSVSYFNTQTETYETARSAPISITVRETRVLTVEDLEGGMQPQELPTTTVRDWREGIRFNYALDTGAVRSDVVGFSLLAADPLLIALLIMPVLFFAAVLIRDRRTARATARAEARARETEAQAEQQGPQPVLERLEGAQAEQALTILRDYLAERLALSPAQRTIPEVAARLQRGNVDEETVQAVSSLLSEYEARRYGEGATRDDEGIARWVREVITELEEAV